MKLKADELESIIEAGNAGTLVLAPLKLSNLASLIGHVKRQTVRVLV